MYNCVANAGNFLPSTENSNYLYIIVDSDHVRQLFDFFK